MNRNAAYPYGETERIACGCGTQLEVSLTRQDGHNEKEEFKCPTCEIEHSARASMPFKNGDVKILKTGD